jgi:type II secretory pathway component PulK
MPRRNGSVLILVLWTIAFLAMIAASLGQGIRARAALVDRLEQRRVLRWLAQGGIARLWGDLRSMGQEEAIRDKDLFDPESIQLGGLTKNANGRMATVLKNWFNAEARLNINLATAEQLSRLFVAIGISEPEGQEMAAAVVDWRDPDTEAGLGGAEDPYYEGLSAPYSCKDAPFERLDELLLVRGFNAKILHKLEGLVTVYGDGPVLIDLTAAPVMVALGLTPELADKIVAYRYGKDNWPGTSDDVFKADSYFEAKSNAAVARLCELVPLTKEEGETLAAALTDGRFGCLTRFFELWSSASFDGKRGSFRIQAVVEISSEADEVGAYEIRLRSWSTLFYLG